MYKDEIIKKVWANREAYVEHHNHNLDAMINDLQSRQRKSERKIVDRRPMPDKAAESDSLNARH